jgi:hypothetical protein
MDFQRRFDDGRLGELVGAWGVDLDQLALGESVYSTALAMPRLCSAAS